MKLSPQILAALALADISDPNEGAGMIPLPEAHPDLYGLSGADRMPPGDNFGYDLAPKVKRPSPPLGFGWNQGMQNKERVKQYLGTKDPPLPSRPVATDYDLMPPGDNFEYDLQSAQGVSSSARPEELKALDKQLAAQVQEGKPSTAPGELVPPGFEGYSPKRSAFEQAITYLGAAMGGSRSDELFNKDREYRKSSLQLKRDAANRSGTREAATAKAQAIAAGARDKAIAEERKAFLGGDKRIAGAREQVSEAKRVANLVDQGGIGSKLAVISLVKAAGESGRLSDQDIQRASNRLGLLPGIWDKSVEMIAGEISGGLTDELKDVAEIAQRAGERSLAMAANERLQSFMAMHPDVEIGSLMKKFSLQNIRVTVVDPESKKTGTVDLKDLQEVLNRGGQIAE